MAEARRYRINSRDEFLAWEAQAEDRYEFLGGIIRMMAGGQVVHNRIAGNLFLLLAPAARQHGCEAFQQNQKLAPDHAQDVVYPDVFVTCRPVRDEDQFIGGAGLVAEVLSKSTAEDDYSWKWELYREMPELRHYLVLDTKAARITHYHRAEAGGPWHIDLVTSRQPLLPLALLDVQLSLADIYAGTSLLTAEGEA
ncbi:MULTISPECIES: Uma2 family endonuclease [Azospirillaceae]|uniref:Uma2 family endonuclease n=1 Tax=Azospirillaceae TaxID=2829815 RepID=UPI000B6FC647|nr:MULTISPECIES: Uma2 family endonuclease [Azospirillaceae]SNR85229.1 Endonuclease, Uma2 family (restriction endonuclease fold) [Azospirillum sp. RU38E]SNS01126.1 Endonuclease, Uma2 family (restriction endonuclease fold) [Azospirillum sp. RU37A]